MQAGTGTGGQGRLRGHGVPAFRAQTAAPGPGPPAAATCLRKRKDDLGMARKPSARGRPGLGPWVGGVLHPEVGVDGTLEQRARRKESPNGTDKAKASSTEYHRRGEGEQEPGSLQPGCRHQSPSPQLPSDRWEKPVWLLLLAHSLPSLWNELECLPTTPKAADLTSSFPWPTDLKTGRGLPLL